MTISARDVTALRLGDVVTLDYPLEKPIKAYLNGKLMFGGEVVTDGPKLALRVGHSIAAV